MVDSPGSNPGQTEEAPTVQNMFRSDGDSNMPLVTVNLCLLNAVSIDFCTFCIELYSIIPIINHLNVLNSSYERPKGPW